MKTAVLLTLFLTFSAVGSAQNFKLKKPNVSQLIAELEQSNFSQSATYLYFTRNYKAKSEKFNIKKYDYAEYDVCAFKQKFDNDIIYSQEGCQEEGGIRTKLTLPKADKTNLAEWVELIVKSSPTNTKYGWNSAKTKFRPIEDEAGCYFEIKENKKNTEIDIYCGC